MKKRTDKKREIRVQSLITKEEYQQLNKIANKEKITISFLIQKAIKWFLRK